jgi:hypothetical protein
MFGRWTISAADYVSEVRRFSEEIGGLDWAAPQDWMCEPAVIHGASFKGMQFVGTGLSVIEHQRRTVDNYLELKALAPDLPWIPVLQGYTPADYLDCAELYERSGVDLGSLDRVGVGSICRREATSEAFDIFSDLSFLYLKLHGFGLKSGFLDLGITQLLESFDSMAWSLRARRSNPLPGCTHQNCANCFKFAMKWREEILGLIGKPYQTSFFTAY